MHPIIAKTVKTVKTGNFVIHNMGTEYGRKKTDKTNKTNKTDKTDKMDKTEKNYKI